MIGYVQDDDASYWADEIAKTLRANPDLHEVEILNCWKPHVFPEGPRHGFVSVHARRVVGRPVTIYHSFLLFTAGERRRA